MRQEKVSVSRSWVRNVAYIVTFSACLAGFLQVDPLPGQVTTGAALALLLGGIPHGATDHILFRHLVSAGRLDFGMHWFYVGYLLLGALYFLLWQWLPSLALCLFILISAYHFGQSNFSTFPFVGAPEAVLTHLLWGLSVILAPVLLHWDESSVIISEITGTTDTIDAMDRRTLLAGLCIPNLIWLGLMTWRNGWPVRRLWREVSALLLLMVLFLFTPLLLGFAIYFFFWHSAGSVVDQLEVLRKGNPGYGFGRYFRQVLPFSFLAFAGLGALYLLLGPSLNQGPNLGILFIFIAIVTVPHTVLMEHLYRWGGLSDVVFPANTDKLTFNR